jgi:hypothetical protein
VVYDVIGKGVPLTDLVELAEGFGLAEGCNCPKRVILKT